jgi:ribosomal 50S subunit-recycling heat shock protein
MRGKDILRLDKFLKVSRIIKRRTLASEACDKKRVLVNGNTSKSGKQINCGDVIEIRFGEKTLKVRVLEVSETVRKDDASMMYEVL